MCCFAGDVDHALCRKFQDNLLVEAVINGVKFTHVTRIIYGTSSQLASGRVELNFLWFANIRDQFDRPYVSIHRLCTRRIPMFGGEPHVFVCVHCYSGIVYGPTKNRLDHLFINRTHP